MTKEASQKYTSYWNTAHFREIIKMKEQLMQGM